MERLYTFLVDHFRQVCVTLNEGGKPVTKDRLLQLQNVLDTLTASLWELSQLMPKFAAKYHRTYLSKLRTLLLKRLQRFAASSTATSAASKLSCTPDLSHLLYFKLLTKIFPTSDYRYTHAPHAQKAHTNIWHPYYGHKTGPSRTSFVFTFTMRFPSNPSVNCPQIHHYILDTTC